METLRHAQAKVTELEKTNKKLNEKAHSDMKEIIRLKEEIQSYRTKVCAMYYCYVQATPTIQIKMHSYIVFSTSYSYCGFSSHTSFIYFTEFNSL